MLYRLEFRKINLNAQITQINILKGRTKIIKFSNSNYLIALYKIKVMLI
jgi:hypothetical protein